MGRGRLFSSAVVYFALALLATGTRHALAEESVATTSTVTTSAESHYSLSDHLALTYFGVGTPSGTSAASYGDAGAGDGPDGASHAFSIQSYVVTGYRPSENWIIGVRHRFETDSFTSFNDAFKLHDPALIVSKRHLIDYGNLTVKGKFLAQIPVVGVDYLKKKRLVTGLSPTLEINYSIPKTRASIGYATYVTKFIANSNSDPKRKTYKFIGSPYATYQISRTLSANLSVDWIQRKFTTTKGVEVDPINIQPGVAWEFARNYVISPMLAIQPGQAEEKVSWLLAMRGRIL